MKSRTGKPARGLKSALLAPVEESGADSAPAFGSQESPRLSLRRSALSVVLKWVQPHMKERTNSREKAFVALPLFRAKQALSSLTGNTLGTPSRHKVPYVKQSAFEREYKILRHYLRYVRAGRSGLGKVREDNRGVSGYLRHRREADRVAFTSYRFKALADSNKVILIAPTEIAYKLRYDLDIYFGDILDGEWDLHRSIDLRDSSKQQSMYERFVLNLPWEETVLFKSVYASRLARGEILRGVDNPRDLALEYGRRVDALFESMKRHGFVAPTDELGRPKTLPHVHIGRDGRFLFGNNGNHRLAIARIIGLKRIPCWVRGRHLQWQQLRERIAEALRAGTPAPLTDDLSGHPDLADLLDVSKQH